MFEERTSWFNPILFFFYIPQVGDFSFSNLSYNVLKSNPISSGFRQFVSIQSITLDTPTHLQLRISRRLSQPSSRRFSYHSCSFSQQPGSSIVVQECGAPSPRPNLRAFEIDCWPKVATKHSSVAQNEADSTDWTRLQRADWRDSVFPRRMYRSLILTFTAVWTWTDDCTRQDWVWPRLSVQCVCYFWISLVVLYMFCLPTFTVVQATITCLTRPVLISPPDRCLQDACNTCLNTNCDL